MQAQLGDEPSWACDIIEDFRVLFFQTNAIPYKTPMADRTVTHSVIVIETHR